MKTMLRKTLGSSVKIPQKKYQELFETKIRYEYLREAMEADFFSPPPTRKSKEIVDAFKKTKKYNQKFLNGLEKGLKRSSHFNV